MPIVKSRICRAAPNIFPFFSPSNFGSINFSGTGLPMSIYTGQWISPSEELGSDKLLPLVSAKYEHYWGVLSQPKFYSIFWWGGSFLWLSLITFTLCLIRGCVTSTMKFGLFVLISTSFLYGIFAVSNDFRYIVPIQILGILVALNGFVALIKTKST